MRCVIACDGGTIRSTVIFYASPVILQKSPQLPKLGVNFKMVHLDILYFLPTKLGSERTKLGSERTFIVRSEPSFKSIF